MIVKQIEYYNETDQKILNNPSDLTAEKLIRGYAFDDIICDEIKIKTSPGIILYINGEEVHIGEVGIYEVPLRENVQVIAIRINEDSIKYIQEHDFSSLTITFIQQES